MITEKRYKELLNFSRVLCNQYDCNIDDNVLEYLHDFIIYTQSKIDLQTANDNIVFIYMRNFFINKLKKKKYLQEELSEYQEAHNEIDVEYEEKINKTTQLKLQAIEEVKNTLTDPRQIDVFNQHIINRKSQRKLARENDINHYVIHRIAKKITQKIKNKYDELYKLQKQNTNTNDKSI